MKKLATIQIDVDGLWVIFQHFGYQKHTTSDILYESALPRFLDLFGQYDIKATFFVVGRDLLVPARISLLKEAVRRGHEIANHTMNHTEGFSYLPAHKKKGEIEEAEKVIESTLGVKPVGFRTPSNDVDEETLKILEDRGYVYDSSLMPTYYGPILKRLKFSSLSIPRKDNYLGKWHYGFSPLHPYNPSYTSLHRRGTMKLLEIPITTMPYLRLPFHASFVFAAASLGLKSLLFDIGFFLLTRSKLGVYNFVFHTNELSDQIFDIKIKRQFGLNLPLSQKQELCSHVLQKITRNFQCVTTKEYVKKFHRTD
ncbi:MAG: polysaccharide deacetylase family protein [Candidatus Omnitrophica bacterium]|nr:polysaccharide deacetylase family protein [Candidatus Omnitrophota bacterium]